jgi:adenylate cyclase
VAREPVRLIKTIGDAAMFVSPDPGALVGVALELVAAVEAAELPTLRAGIALGPALQRAGDYYGHSVNLASRVTGVARAASVLCTQEVHDAAPEAYEWSFAGKHRMKGLPEPVPLHRARVKPAESEDSPPGDGEAGAPEAKKRRADRRRKRAAS